MGNGDNAENSMAAAIYEISLRVTKRNDSLISMGQIISHTEVTSFNRFCVALTRHQYRRDDLDLFFAIIFIELAPINFTISSGDSLCAAARHNWPMAPIWTFCHSSWWQPGGRLANFYWSFLRNIWL